AGTLPSIESVRWATLDELEAMVSGELVPLALEDRVPPRESPELPTHFRLSATGEVVAESGERERTGQAASGGRVIGRVHSAGGTPEPGDVLVVRNLDPRLSAILPSLAGLVSETGSVLSHLAILAREYGIPTVVGVDGALERFPHGSTIVVDGTLGEITVLEEGVVA
ncbi:MAG: PEP-utilizing enzyme, partial [Actinomycetota bacterium]|nr:PEP-utilizing enzyme [Actinomycetota bacterium]